MTCLPIDHEIVRARAPRDVYDQVRAAVFWGFILLVIVSPAALGLWVIAQG
jgi:hypothetical protein